MANSVQLSRSQMPHSAVNNDLYNLTLRCSGRIIPSTHCWSPEWWRSGESSPVVQLLLIFKNPKWLHGLTELSGVLVVNFSWGRETNGRGDPIVFLGRLLLPTRHGAAGETSWNDSLCKPGQLTCHYNQQIAGRFFYFLNTRMNEWKVA